MKKDWKRHAVKYPTRSALSLVLSLTMMLTLLSPELLQAQTDSSDEEAAEAVSADYDAESVAYASDEVIIVYKDEIPEEEEESGDASSSVLEEAGVTEQEEISGAQADGTAVVARLDESVSVEEAIEILAEDPAVDYAQPNYSYTMLTEETEEAAEADAVTSDAAADTQYYLYESSFTDAWDYAVSDGTVTVAVLDTGCNLQHEDLIDTVNADLAYDVTTGTLLSESGTENNGDAMGHGTYVCGVLAASAANGIGIAGASYNADVLPVKVFDEEGICTTADLIAAYAYLAERIDAGDLNDLKVINISLGYYADEEDDADAALEAAISDMRSEYGVLTVCAGGNGTGSSARTDYCYPADFDVCVSVTAVDETGANASFSDYNDAKDISAYGVDIYTTSADGGYEYATGTSVAAPQVAAAAALLWAADTSLSTAEVVSILQDTSTEVSGNLHESTMDIGIVNAASAVKQVLGIEEDDDVGIVLTDDAQETGDEADNADETDAAAEDTEEADELLEIEEAFDSWRYSDGQVIDNADTDTLTGTISTLTTYPHSTWKASYGTSYLGIAKSSSSTTKVAVSGVKRVVIDVSKWQGSIDWAKVAAAGVTAAIIRCGYGSNSTSYDDAYFLTNVQGALENGIKIGVYLYSYATTTSGAASEAAHVLRLLNAAGLSPNDLDLPVFLDMEDSTQGSVGASTLANIATTFCNTIEAEGYAVGIYSSKSWWDSKLTNSAFSTGTWYKWVARYPTSTSVSSSDVDGTDLWQFTSQATVSGISGNVDVSFDYLGSGSYLPAQVTLKSVTLTSATAATLTWGAVSWADGYQVWRSTNGGTYALIATVSGTSYVDSTLSLNVTYKYKVRPYQVVTTTTTSTVTDATTGETTSVENTSSETVYGSYSSALSVTTLPSKVTISSATKTVNGYVKVSWKKVANASGYVVYRSVNGGSYKKVKTITSGSTLSWTNLTVIPGRVYRYKVKAYQKSGSTIVYSTSYSAVKKVTAKPGKATISSAKSTKKRSITVKWKKVSKVTGYQVAYRVNGTSKWYYTTVKSASKTLTSLRSSKKYVIKVRAYRTYKGKKYYGSWSSTVKIKAKQ